MYSTVYMYMFYKKSYLYQYTVDLDLLKSRSRLSICFSG